MSKIISIKPAKKLGLVFASNFDRLCESLETGVFTIIIVWGGALDAYTYFIAEAWAMSILVSQTYFLCSQVCTWSFATEAFRSKFN